jgi:hypothetical protein
VDKGCRVSKERARRRAEREAAVAAAAAERAAAAEKRARRATRKDRLTGWVPRPAARQTGLLAEKRRRQAGGTFAVLVAFNLLVFAFTRDFYVTAFTLVASLLGAPIVHMMLFRKG